MSYLAKTVIAFAALAAAGLLLGANGARAAGSVCTAQAPAGGLVRGPVLQVEDGDTLCVALGATPDRWVRLTLADAPSANPIQHAANTDENPRGTLMAVAFSQTVDCRLQADGRAVCALQDGRSVGNLLKTRAAWAAGKEWR
jgi:micrococcal nuclease